MVAGLLSGLHCWNGASESGGIRSPILRLAVTSDGRQLWIRRGISEVLSYDLDTGQIQKILNGKQHRALSSQVSDDGQTHLVASDANELRVFRNNNLILFETGDDDLTVRTALSANGRMAVRVLNGSQVQCWDVTSETPVASTFRLPEPVARIAIDYSGQMLVAATEQAFVHVCDVNSGKTIQLLRGLSSLTADPIVSRDGQWLVLGLRSSVDLFDLTSGELAWSIAIDDSDGIQACAISPDADWVAVSGIMTGVQLIGRASGQIRSHWSNSTGLHRVVFSADSRTLFIGMDDGSINARSLPDGQARTLLAAHGS